MGQLSWSRHGMRAVFLIALLVLGPLAHVGCVGTQHEDPEWWDSGAPPSQAPVSPGQSLAVAFSQVLQAVALLVATVAIAFGYLWLASERAKRAERYD